MNCTGSNFRTYMVRSWGVRIFTIQYVVMEKILIQFVWKKKDLIWRYETVWICWLILIFIVCICITKTYLYNFDPLKPHFYIIKLGFTGVYFFLFLLKNIDCGYMLEPPHQGSSNEYPQSMFWAEIWKISFFIWKFSVFGGENFYIFE